MTDEAPALSRDDVRQEARQILAALNANREHRQRFEEIWRKLWQLAREARAADLPSRNVDGPWSIYYDRVSLLPFLTTDSFRIPIWPASDGRSQPDLAKLLNWAGVPADAR